MLLQVSGVSKQIAGRVLFADVGLSVRTGDRVGLIGPNGAGKTTLMRILAGDEPPDDGRVQTPRHTRVGMLRQEIDPMKGHSVREEAHTALAGLDELEKELREIEQEMASLGRNGDEVPEDLAEDYHRASLLFEHGGGFDREARVERVLAGLGFSEAQRAAPLRSFSGGWLMRVELAKLLLSEPDVLLLDEPTNHLDLPSIEWLEQLLESFPGAIVLISHDRTFLRKHVRRVAELEAGRFTLYEAGYDRYLEMRAERRAQLLAAKENQDKKIAAQQAFVDRFRAKATKAKQAQSRLKALERMERIEIPIETTRKLRLRLPEPARCGDIALRLTGIHKCYGDNQVYAGAKLVIARGDHVALVGPNGAGKSTLLKIAAGILDFDAGERQLGHNVTIGHFAQHQLESLHPAYDLVEELSEGARTDDLPRIRGQLGAFLFSGDDFKKKVSVLSGGEKARLALAKMLLRPPNFLILDEPTNHLDIAACEVLEEALAGYAGTILLISHDRSFLNRVTTRVIEIEAGQLFEFPGNYDAYLERITQRDQAEPGHKPELSALRQTAPISSPSEPPGSNSSRNEHIAKKAEKRKREKAARDLAKLEAEIAQVEASIQAIEAQLADPEVYRDVPRFRRLEREHTEKASALDRLLHAWEEVCVLAETSP